MSAKKIAQFGMLTAAALVLGWVERFIPVAPGIPGIKLGLGNTVLLYAVYMLNAKESALLMVMKVLLSGFLFAGLSGMLYSFAGGTLSLIVMLLLKWLLEMPLLSRISRINIIIVSVLGAVAHNLGQITVACFVVLTRAVLVYLPVLMASGIITGLLTGVVAKYVLLALKLHKSNPKPASGGN